MGLREFLMRILMRQKPSDKPYVAKLMINPELPIKHEIEEALQVITDLASSANQINAIALALVNILRKGGTLFVIGNGGSAAAADHFAAELVGRFLRDRDPLAAISLTTNGSLLTALINDYSAEDLFTRQITALVRSGDCVVAFSTSGQSANVLKGLAAARQCEATTIGFTGRLGEANFLSLCDHCLAVSSDVTPRIQEAHLLLTHLICNLLEQHLCDESTSLGRQFHLRS